VIRICSSVCLRSVLRETLAIFAVPLFLTPETRRLKPNFETSPKPFRYKDTPNGAGKFSAQDHERRKGCSWITGQAAGNGGGRCSAPAYRCWTEGRIKAQSSYVPKVFAGGVIFEELQP